MLSILAAATAALTPMGPVDGLCKNYSKVGDIRCISWSTDKQVVIYDGHNTMVYRRVFGPVYSMTLNGYTHSNHLCSLKGNNFSCLLHVNFEANETQIYPLGGPAYSNYAHSDKSRGASQPQ